MLARLEGPDIDIVLWPEPPVDPIGDPHGFERQVDDAVAAGATIINLRFASRSLAHHLEQMEAARSRSRRRPPTAESGDVVAASTPEHVLLLSPDQPFSSREPFERRMDLVGGRASVRALVSIASHGLD